MALSKARFTTLGLAAVLATLVSIPKAAHADDGLVGADMPLLNKCKPTSEKPYPVVFVHGQGGGYEGFTMVYDRLAREGYCVYATSYGIIDGGKYGQGHLNTSGEEVDGFIDQVLADTGAEKVDMVGYSAGVGVTNNIILGRDGSAKIHSFVAIGGLHHPYAHIGVPPFADFDVFLPNLWDFAHGIFPALTFEQAIDTLINTFGVPLGITQDSALAQQAKIPFVADLFDSSYWKRLHGGLSEPPGTILRPFTNGRTLRTRDTVSSICYTNIVASSDIIAGRSAGFADEASNVENFLVTTSDFGAGHSLVITDERSQDKMIEGLQKDCGGGGVGARSLRPLAVDDEDTLEDASEDSSEDADVDVSAKQKAFKEAFVKAIQEDHGLRPGQRKAEAADPGACSMSRGLADGGSFAPYAAFAALGVVLTLRRRKS